jgi:hypothetical protein
MFIPDGTDKIDACCPGDVLKKLIIGRGKLYFGRFSCPGRFFFARVTGGDKKKYNQY